MNERLARLAERCGIARSYHDVQGREQTASETTLAALLVAMRVLDEATPEAIEAALAAREAPPRDAALPPVIVLHDDAPSWSLPIAPDADCEWRIELEDGSVRHGRGSRELPAELRPPAGYHALTLSRGGQTLAQSRLIVAPRCAWQPPALQGEGRAWGIAAQLYALRTERNWGIGDFTDLRHLVEWCHRHGAGVVGVNPLHAMFVDAPGHASPYSPSSRLFLNVLYIDVEAVDDFAECAAARELVQDAAFRERLAALRASPLVDYSGVASLKHAVLRRLYEGFRQAHLAPGSARAQAFDAFRRGRGPALRRHALFEALQERFRAADAAVHGWPDWPAAWRDPEAPEVAAFERDRLEAVEYYEYLQWLADLQLAAVGRRSWELGLAVGLYVDLALAMDRGGAEAWSEQASLARGASLGAPPDALNPIGQDWGLPPFDPERLRAAGYAPFIAALRANMFHAGALRIDHVMSLMRLYWIAPGAAADAGAYVHYAFDELLAIVALESRRNRCLVIGEDLGTVPPEVRTRLAAAGVLSYRVLLFERDAGGAFLPPAAYPRQSVAVASTHDLPTLAGWWQGRDLALREQLGLLRGEDVAPAQAERARDRALLLGALESERLVPPHARAQAQLDAPTLCAAHAFLARSPAQLVLVQAEDMLLALDGVNVPGTTNEVPNWRRRLTQPMEAWDGEATLRALLRAIDRERRAPASAHAREGAIPRATYRLQLHREFGFVQARAVVPYLAAFGISHLYCSPLLRARPGSRHGYDVVDHTALNPELGTREDFERLVATLHEHGMGLVADIVPNHMGVLNGDNAWWLDVLENGPASAWADYFDIEWQAADPSLTGRVLLPILGEQYGVVLERGELRLGFDLARGAFTLGYFEHRLPIDPASYAPLLRRALRQLPVAADGADALGALADAFERLPASGATDAAARSARQRDAAASKAQLGALARTHPALAQAIDASVQALNGRPGARASMDALDALIDAQAYRLAHWRVAADEINYRRFFDINELAALRMERPEVFEATHRFVLELAAQGAIDGLRVDHPDGLADPAGYFARLQARHAELAGLPPRASGAHDTPARSLYVVIEKIVAPHEQVARDWAVHGTTGYRFANVVNALLVDGAARQRLDRAWRAFVRDEAEDFDVLGWRCRHVVMDGPLAGELTVLATALLRLAREDRRTRDFTLHSLRRALAEVVAAFPVYRTYIVERPSPQDRRFIDWAIGRARRRSVAADASVFDFLRRVLLGRPLPGAPAGQAARYLAFVRRFQQYTAPVAAKGIEDTALYRHQRLVSLNDVGGDPDMFGLSVAAFHAASRDRALHWPQTMLATSTHDAKRSEDVRARIDVISEMPAAWRLAVRRWSRMNRRHRRIVDGVPAPSRNDEYLLYQTLVGSLPRGPLDDAALARYAERIDAAMLKSTRESKAITSWMNPHAAYEAALSSFVRALLARRDSNLFLEDLEANAAVFAWYGALNGLTIATLKCLSPGVPDIYQGQEAIELALVDPDNRRPVDFEQRREWLARAQTLASGADRSVALHEMLAAAPDGRAKFWATWRSLELRRECAAQLEPTDYRPLEARGARAAHVVAFARRAGADWIVAIGVRLYASLGLQVGELPIGDVWADTELLWPEAQLGPVEAFEDAIAGARHRLEGGALRLAEVLRDFPVAALRGRARA